jgi:hypothetical protein
MKGKFMSKTEVISVSLRAELHSAQSANSQSKPNDGFVDLDDFVFGDGENLASLKLHYLTLGTPRRIKRSFCDLVHEVWLRRGNNPTVFLDSEKTTDRCVEPGRFVRSRTAVADARSAVSLDNSSVLGLTRQTKDSPAIPLSMNNGKTIGAAVSAYLAAELFPGGRRSRPRRKSSASLRFSRHARKPSRST